MPAFTNFLGLYKPGGGSTGLILPDEVVDIDRINSNMDAIDLFAKGWGQSADRNHQFYGPAASLAGVTGMKLGDTYQESDGSKVLWKFDGIDWRLSPGTLIKSVTNASDQATIGSGFFVTTDAALKSGQKVKVEVSRIPVFATTAALLAVDTRIRVDGTDVTSSTGTLVAVSRASVPGGSNVVQTPGHDYRHVMAGATKLSVGLFFSALSVGTGGIYGADGTSIRLVADSL